jgi:hypothetical protein
MLKYIADLANKVKERSSGMEQNSAAWTNMPITKTQVDAYLGKLELADKQIFDAKNLVQQKQELARNLVEEVKKIIIQVDNFALGIHTSDSEKLNMYGITPRHTPSPRPVPEKTIILSIEDDADAEGFVITIQPLDHVDYFEIEKAVSTTPGTISMEPPYPFFKTTRKLKFIDDDIKKGVRYFYRIRGINNKGSGAWSETVSRVQ